MSIASEFAPKGSNIAAPASCHKSLTLPRYPADINWAQLAGVGVFCMDEADNTLSKEDRATAKAIAEHAVAWVTKQAPSYLQETAVADLMRADPKAIEMAESEVRKPTMNEKYGELSLEEQNKAIGVIGRSKGILSKDTTDYTPGEIFKSAYEAVTPNKKEPQAQAFYGNLLQELVTANRPLAEEVKDSLDEGKRSAPLALCKKMSEAIQCALDITGGQNVDTQGSPPSPQKGAKKSCAIWSN